MTFEKFRASEVGHQITKAGTCMVISSEYGTGRS
jgi:hypothetical protein